jgi:PIN domain
MPDETGLPLNRRRVVLDANVLLQHKRPSIALRVLGREVRRGRMELVVPELVVKEVANKQREAVAEAEARARGAIKELQDLKALDASPNFDVDAEQAGADAEHNVRAMLVELGAEIPEIPSPSHRDLVSRSLEKRKPFSDKGDKGYRDALIWENVREIAGPDAPVTLVSADRKAFHGPGDQLPGDLAGDLPDDANVEVVSELRLVIDRYVDREIVLLQEMEAAFEDEGIRDQIADHLDRALTGVDVRYEQVDEMYLDDLELDLGADDEIEYVSPDGGRIGASYGVGWLNVLDARELADDQIGITFECEVEVEVDLDVAAEIRTRERTGSGEIELSRSTQFLTIPRSATAGVSADAGFDRKNGKVADLGLVTVHKLV